MKIRITLIFCLFITAYALNAQINDRKRTNTEFPVIKPAFIISDIYVAIQILDGIELTGNEVEAFIEVRDNLKSYLEIAKNQKLKVTDSIKVEMQGHIAQNTITFMSRSTLKGNMADQYKRFFDAIIEASKK